MKDIEIKNPALLLTAVAATVVLLVLIEGLKSSFDIYDVLSWFGMIDGNQIAQYRQLGTDAHLKAADWSPNDIISLIGTVGQIIVGLVGCFVSWHAIKRQAKE